MMKVVHIVPGSGGTFYCQNCMRDSALVPALRNAGVDAVMMPLYLPLFTDGNPVDAERPVFFGGINAWLQQEVPLFRKTPRWVDRLFDSRWMLKRAAQMEGTTSPEDLGPMQFSMLRGEDGNQRKEVERLVEFLKEHEKPDVVHISNALLLGLAKEIKQSLNVPIVCSLQDEEGWLDAMAEPYRTQCWELLAERCQYVDRFMAVSKWYGKRMQQRLKIPDERIETVYVGIDLSGYQQASLDFDPPVIGFLSRMNAELGLDALVDAFIEIKRMPGLKKTRFRATGGLVGDDRKCVEQQREKLRQTGFENDVEFLPDFSREQRQAFLKSLSILCVPVKAGEAFGTFIIESLAAGVPVVMPNIGAFPELIAATGGGVVYENDPVDALKRLLMNPAEAKVLGARGCAAVSEHFSIERMAEKVVEIYENVSQTA